MKFCVRIIWIKVPNKISFKNYKIWLYRLHQKRLLLSSKCMIPETAYRKIFNRHRFYIKQLSLLYFFDVKNIFILNFPVIRHWSSYLWRNKSNLFVQVFLIQPVNAFFLVCFLYLIQVTKCIPDSLRFQYSWKLINPSDFQRYRLLDNTSLFMRLYLILHLILVKKNASQTKGTYGL